MTHSSQGRPFPGFLTQRMVAASYKCKPATRPSPLPPSYPASPSLISHMHPHLFCSVSPTVWDIIDFGQWLLGDWMINEWMNKRRPVFGYHNNHSNHALIQYILCSRHLSNCLTYVNSSNPQSWHSSCICWMKSKHTWGNQVLVDQPQSVASVKLIGTFRVSG